jgi:glutathione S-transferase
VRAILFGVPSSHPTVAAELMLARKGIEVRRVDFAAGVHRLALKALGFPRMTVPALRLDGQRLQGTRTIALALDVLVPEPPLVPADPERRDAVLRAESWGDEVLQPVGRRLAWAALKRDRSTLSSYLEDAKLGIPPALAARTAPPIIRLAARLNRADDAAAQRDLRALPGLIDRVDGLIADGVLRASDPTVADFQIATTVRLLMTFDDLRGAFAGRPAAEHAETVVPRYPGRTGPVFPAAWVPAAAA